MQCPGDSCAKLTISMVKPSTSTGSPILAWPSTQGAVYFRIDRGNRSSLPGSPGCRRGRPAGRGPGPQGMMLTYKNSGIPQLLGELFDLQPPYWPSLTRTDQLSSSSIVRLPTTPGTTPKATGLQKASHLEWSPAGANLGQCTDSLTPLTRFAAKVACLLPLVSVSVQTLKKYSRVRGSNQSSNA